MSSVIKTLLDDYARCKQATKEAKINYNKAKEEAMRFLRYENQTKDEIEYKFAKVKQEEEKGYFMGDGSIPSSNRAHYYNAYLVPITRCKINEIRRSQAEKCKEAKAYVKHRQMLEERARNKLLKFFDERAVWFVATVRDAKQEVEDIIKEAKGLPKDYKYENHDSRTWGFYYDLGEALNAVHENWTDMNEAGYYDYAVIEPHDVGLLGIEKAVSNTLWFKAEYEERKTEAGTPYKCCVRYKECETPKWAEHTVGWCLS